ncbi:hypothetical protein [Microlunatus sp. Y2014]|uniref:hypothetical protein n=1 Tax=Microlunatus sp. Y2014 TaxID=3418488 RepID=UPI003DA76225
MAATSAGPRRSWISDATIVLDSGPTPPAVDEIPLDVIDTTLDIATMITDELPDIFFGWISDALGSFTELLKDFTGDSSAIVAHADATRTIGDQVLAYRTPVAGASARTGRWQGATADAFAATTKVAGECVRATAESIHALATRQLVLGGQVATVKQDLINAVTRLAGQLVEWALDAISNAGLALVDGTVQVISGTVSGAYDGFRDGWSEGGLFGAIRGAGDGAIDGAADALREAFDGFVSWAGDHVADVLGEAATFVEEALTAMSAELGQVKGVGQRAERAAALLTTGADPGYNADAPASGTAGEQVQGQTAQERDRDLIDINQAIGDPDADLPEGWSRASDAQLAEMGLTRDMLTGENGFIAEVFFDPDGNPVVAFAGTTAGESPDSGTGTVEVVYDDVTEDVTGAVTVSPQTQQVLTITEAISASPYADDTTFTGHSLGGRHAAVASLDTGNAAVTFNAAGVSPGTVEYLAASNNTTGEQLLQQAGDGQVRRYHTGNDPLTAVQEELPDGEAIPAAPGSPIQLGPDSEVPVDGHGQGEVETAFDEQYPEPIVP